MGKHDSLFRFLRDNGGGILKVGPWMARFTWPWYPGRFRNGSRWFSGWHRWDSDEDYEALR